MDGRVLASVLARLRDMESMTWQHIESSTGSHLVAAESVCKAARDRLEEIQQDDVTNLFSLRMSGAGRVWGIRDGRVLVILWWDPCHQVCPSHKKHT